MYRSLTSIILILLTVTALGGCALGKKEWPSAVRSEDAFSLKIVEGSRQDTCLMLNVSVTGAAHRLWRVTVQLEPVGLDEGDGCSGCPFVPRRVVHFQRDNKAIDFESSILKLSVCTLESGKEYRFRVVGKSELSTSPLVFTDVYQALP